MRRGFTLLEILLALAVIALLSTVLIGMSAGLLREKSATADDVFWTACQAARKEAVKTGNQVLLTFDDKAKAFLETDGARSQTFPIPGASQDLSVNFLNTQGDRYSILVGGVAIETGTAPSVVFFADGTCTPFRIQIRLPSGAHVLAVDPWTCAKVLAAKEEGT
jgi:general secretion pathway protein H